MSPGEAETVDQYIAGFAEPARTALEQVRQAIKDAAPQAREKYSYKMITFTLNGNLVHAGAFRDFVALHGIPFDELREELAGYRGTKGSVRFPLDQPMPLELIRRLVERRVAENQPKKGK
jgi:uncharacterized protein YdhG (YjbR/CyaY superfamily)